MRNKNDIDFYCLFRADPRHDPLLGPLLAELDAMSNTQQQALPKSPPRRTSVPYLVQPGGSSNHSKTGVYVLFTAHFVEACVRAKERESI